MKRTLLKSKIHRAKVTEANLDYEGSITIDTKLMAAADLVEFEKVEIFDINNGSRFATYVIPGESGSGTICLNGAAARMVAVNDLVIICSYAEFSEDERAVHEPKIVSVTDKNRIRRNAKKTK